MQISLQSTQYLQEKKQLKSWVLRALLVTISINFPIGIIGLIFSIRSRRKIKKHDMEGARKDAKRARLWTIIAFWTGITVLAGEIIYYFAR